MTDKKPKYDLEGLGKTEINEVIALEYAKGFAQGKLAVLDSILEMFGKETDHSDGPGIICYKKTCYEDAICKHEILRLKSQLSEKEAKK